VVIDLSKLDFSNDIRLEKDPKISKILNVLKNTPNHHQNKQMITQRIQRIEPKVTLTIQGNKTIVKYRRVITNVQVDIENTLTAKGKSFGRALFDLHNFEVVYDRKYRNTLLIGNVSAAISLQSNSSNKSYEFLDSFDFNKSNRNLLAEFGVGFIREFWGGTAFKILVPVGSRSQFQRVIP
jgi:hypothetical protein